MLRLANRELQVDLLDPVADAARLGPRYCWGGYIWQVHDQQLGPLLAGPEFPEATPTPFNGQGLPESFRHRTRTGAPLTWQGQEGLVLGGGRLTAGENDAVVLTEPCRWTTTRCAQGESITFATRQAAAGRSYELTRQVELVDRTVTSHTELRNVGAMPLSLQWFAHPFWPLERGRAQLHLPAGSALPPNPGFALKDRVLSFRRPFLSEDDQQFSLLELPAGQELSVAVTHPKLARATFATSFVPDECPLWANAHCISVEPYLYLDLAPGAARRWHVRHGFEQKGDPDAAT